MNRAPLFFAVSFAVSSVACGSGSSKLTVNLKASSDAFLTPYQPAVGLAKVRISIAASDGSLNQTSYADLAMPTDKTATFDKLPDAIKAVNVRVDGFDEVGRVVAFGRATAVAPSVGSIDVPFRRNLAYVTHAARSVVPNAAGTLYVFDIASRTLSATMQLPMPGAIGRGVSPKGGDGMLVNFDVMGHGFLGFLSADDNQWTVIPLNAVQDLTFGTTGSNIVVSGGGTKLSIVDVSKKMVLKEFDLGGTVVDGAISDDGKHAVLIAADPPGMQVVDLSDTCLSALDRSHCLRNIMAVEQPGGVALACDGHTAYVTSSGTREVAELDLGTLQGRYLNRAAFPTGVGPAAYSCAMQGVLALDAGPNGAPHVYAFGTAVRGSCPPSDPCDGDPLGFDQSTGTLYYPVDIAADPSGHRLLVVEAGTSTASSGLTIIETAFQQVPVGSTGIYPVDPNDVVMQGERKVHNRYQPSHIGVLYGR